MFGPFFVGEQRTYVVTVKNRNTGAAIDISGYTAKVFFRKNGETTNKWSGASVDATVSTPLAGEVTWVQPAAWADADIGRWHMQVELINSSKPEITESIAFSVEDSLHE